MTRVSVRDSVRLVLGERRTEPGDAVLEIGVPLRIELLHRLTRRKSPRLQKRMFLVDALLLFGGEKPYADLPQKVADVPEPELRNLTPRLP